MPNFEIKYPTKDTFWLAYDTPINNTSVIHIGETKKDQVTDGSRVDLEEFQIPNPETPVGIDNTKNAVKARINVIFATRPDLEELLEQVDNL